MFFFWSFRENYMLQDVEDVQISLVTEKVLYQIHHLRYQDVILQCQVNNLLSVYFFNHSSFRYITLVLIKSFFF